MKATRTDFHIRLGNIFIDSFGIEFQYGDDDVLWLWPWNRKKLESKAFFSMSFNCSFSSLEELDNTWKQYFRDLKKSEENV